MIVAVEARNLNIGIPGLLRNQGETSIDFYFIMVPLRKKYYKVWYSKAQILLPGTLVEQLSQIDPQEEPETIEPNITV